MIFKMNIIGFIFQSLLGELVVVIAGFIIAKTLLSYYDKRRFGGWRVIVIKNGKQIVNRPISVRKAKEILDDSADLSVFLKGVASPYGWIKCDIISEGEKIGLLKIDRENRKFFIDLDKNPREITKVATMNSTTSPSAVVIELDKFFVDTAKLKDLPLYIKKSQEVAGSGNEVVLTGRAPVWLYLAVAHALHGKAKKLIYRSPVTGDVVIFDHNPF